MATISSDREKAFGFGAIEHLIKPIDRKMLLDALGRHSYTTKVTTRPIYVLAIDDDPTHLELMRSALEPSGFVVTTEESGLAGLESAKRGPCDLLLLDLALPDISGVEIIAALRQHEPTRKLPIVLITAHDLSPALRARLNGEVQMIMAKGDLHVEGLIAEIDQILGKKS
jgi:CheY-like chemotaxis protein